MEFIAHRGESADAPENTLAAFRSSEQFPVISFDADTLAEAKRCLPEHLAFSGPIDAIAPRR